MSEGLPDFDALWDYGDPAGTEQAFSQLLTPSSGLPDYHAQLLTQIARAQGLQRDFGTAHATLDLVEPMLEAATPIARARYLLERGRAFNSSGVPDRAAPLFLEAFEVAGEAGADFHAVDAAHMMGIVEEGDASIEWNERAIALAEASPDERARGWLGSLYNNTGWSHHDLGDFDSAMDMFESALDYYTERGREPQRRIALWTVGRTLRSMGELDEALAKQRELRGIYEAAGDEEAGYCAEEIGECLHALDREDEARPYFAEAYARLSKDAWLRDGEPERLARLAELGGVSLPEG